MEKVSTRRCKDRILPENVSLHNKCQKGSKRSGRAAAWYEYWERMT